MKTKDLADWRDAAFRVQAQRDDLLAALNKIMAAEFGPTFDPSKPLYEAAERTYWGEARRALAKAQPAKMGGGHE